MEKKIGELRSAGRTKLVLSEVEGSVRPYVSLELLSDGFFLDDYLQMRGHVLVQLHWHHELTQSL
jgi:hypothetical protein